MTNRYIKRYAPDNEGVQGSGPEPAWGKILEEVTFEFSLECWVEVCYVGSQEIGMRDENKIPVRFCSVSNEMMASFLY